MEIAHKRFARVESIPSCENFLEILLAFELLIIHRLLGFILVHFTIRFFSNIPSVSSTAFKICGACPLKTSRLLYPFLDDEFLPKYHILHQMMPPQRSVQIYKLNRIPKASFCFVPSIEISLINAESAFVQVLHVYLAASVTSHVLSGCRIAFRNNHFLSELIHVFT